MLKPTIFTFLVISTIFLTSCDSNHFVIQIENNSTDSIQVNYVLMENTDSLYFDGSHRIIPTIGVGLVGQKYDSVTRIHTFSIAPKRTCTLVNVINHELDNLSDFVLCKRLEIIKESDTIISKEYREISTIFNQSNERHKAVWTLVVN